MPSEKTKKDGGNRAAAYYFAPESESAARVAALLPTKGREDASWILGAIARPREETAPVGPEDRDYLPSTASEWVVHVDIENSEELTVAWVEGVFGEEWRSKSGRDATIFGKDARTGRWTYLTSVNGPRAVTALQFAWSYSPRWTDDAEITKAATYEARLTEIMRRMARAGCARVRADLAPAAAQRQSEHLSAIRKQFAHEIMMILEAPLGRAFAGREVWDVMLSLGLHWGDMDCFHWRNNYSVGDQFFFSVWTSSPPGYFLPEEIAANRLEVCDLVFGYSLPRSIDPAGVYTRMLGAVKYAQKRLGGAIITETGAEPSDATLSQIQGMAKRLDELGFTPGSQQALRFF